MRDLTSDKREEIGRASYEAFRAAAKRDGQRDTAGHLPWESLSEPCREANRKAAEVAYWIGWRDAMNCPADSWDYDDEG